MKIINKAKNFELTLDLQNFIDKKIGLLEKFVPEVFVELEKETEHHQKGKIFVCQLKVNLPGTSLVARVESDDLYKAIVDAKRELEQEIKKHKFKKIDKARRAQRKSKRIE